MYLRLAIFQALVAIAMACGPIPTGVFAQSDPLAYHIDIYRITASGERIPSTEARLGEVVEYVVTVSNVSDTTLPSGLVQIRLPVPEGTVYLSGTATHDADTQVEFLAAGSTVFVDREPSNVAEIRWTLFEELAPGQQFVLVYRVALPFPDGRLPSNPTTGPATGAGGAPTSVSLQRWVDVMFGHLGIVMFTCPTNLSSARPGSICGETRSSFDLFRRGRDLYADWPDQVPAIAQPHGAWRRTNDTYQRSYALGSANFTVHYLDGTIVVTPQ